MSTVVKAVGAIESTHPIDGCIISANPKYTLRGQVIQSANELLFPRSIRPSSEQVQINGRLGKQLVALDCRSISVCDEKGAREGYPARLTTDIICRGTKR